MPNKESFQTPPPLSSVEKPRARDTEPSKEDEIIVEACLNVVEDDLVKLKKFVQNAIGAMEMKFINNLALNYTMLDTRVGRLEQLLKANVAKARPKRQAMKDLEHQMKVGDGTWSEAVKGQTQWRLDAQTKTMVERMAIS
ncbi:hypothetical protein Scep_004769 [Stephania cephalantha]|uniref:Uncharacterized protein n=1 Tax=Stephania cephalantha TaxID=152367 RepID=A0AAP0KTZ2_9MAGN